MEIRRCDSFGKKLKGLMFKKSFDYGVRIRCNGIHTFFMFKAIDVVLTDKNNMILYIYKNVKPNRIIWPKKGVFYTYELPSNTVIKNKVGEKFII